MPDTQHSTPQVELGLVSFTAAHSIIKQLQAEARNSAISNLARPLISSFVSRFTIPVAACKGSALQFWPRYMKMSKNATKKKNTLSAEQIRHQVVLCDKWSSKRTTVGAYHITSYQNMIHAVYWQYVRVCLLSRAQCIIKIAPSLAQCVSQFCFFFFSSSGMQDPLVSVKQKTKKKSALI